jgi:hypothetical protein
MCPKTMLAKNLSNFYPFLGNLTTHTAILDMTFSIMASICIFKEICAIAIYVLDKATIFAFHCPSHFKRRKETGHQIR